MKTSRIPILLLVLLLLGLCSIAAEAASISDALAPLVSEAKSFFITFAHLLAFGCFLWAVNCLLKGQYSDFGSAAVATLFLAAGPSLVDAIFVALGK